MEQNPKSPKNNKRKPYTKPVAKSESMLVYGALCNGTANAGRKASTGAPNFCNSTKLLS